MTLHHLAALVHWPGMAIYGAVLSIFADKLLVQRKAQRDTLVAFLAWGSALGLAMGAWVFGGIGLHPLQYGLAWPEPLDPTRGLMFAKYCVSALLWASSFHLQIWTLEALGKAPDEPGDLASAIQAITGQLGLNATLFHVLGLLSLLSIH